jgi:D-lactate dehydrogenase (cytochrome)
VEEETMLNPTAAGVLQRLRPLLGERITDAIGVCSQFGRSEAYRVATPPDLVARPSNKAEVQEIVRACHDARLPVVPFGAGTSLEGNASAVNGGLCIDMSGMDAVVAVNAEDMDVRVQPGIRRKALNAQLRDTGLFFPIDPGADASIGGMASTRGSGTMAVRYGTMRDNVLALEVVLPDGKIITTARRARKSAAGYDLTRLFVGSEGTLGVITEVTLRLHPQPEAIAAAVCPFATLGAAIYTAIATIQSAVPVARIELLDDIMMRGINRYSNLSYPETPTLFLEFHGTPAAVAEQAQIVQGIAAEHGAAELQWAREPEARSKLWHARDNTLYAGRGLRPGSEAIITDVCVPISALAECIAATRQDLEESQLMAPLVGHVGDGNFHLLILVDPANESEIARARAFHSRLVERALALDGTCTGEHGVGTGKIAYLEAELGEAVSVMRSIKQAIDPLNIMNPGKIFRGPAALFVAA